MDEMPVYLTKEALTPVKSAWDTKGRLDDMESMYSQLRSDFASADLAKAALEESLSLYKSRGVSYFRGGASLFADPRQCKSLPSLTAS